MIFLTVLLVTFFILGIGLVLIGYFHFLEHSSFLEKLCYGWGLGVGLIAFQMFAYSVFNISWNRFSLIYPWFVVFIAYFIHIKFRFDKFKKIKLHLDPIEMFFLCLILLLILFVGFESILRPVQAWDAWDNWVWRPQIFFMHNNIDIKYFSYAGDDYPLVIPLMGTFFYIILGEINDKYILFLFFIFYAALGGLFFETARKLFTGKIAFILTYLLLALQNFVRHGGRFEVGQADLALSYYIFAGSALLLHFINTKNARTLVLLSVYLGITAQIKNDGIPFFVVVNSIIFLFIIIWKKYKYFFPSIISFLLILPWQIYKGIYHINHNILFVDGLKIHFDRILAVPYYMSLEFLNFQNWSLLWGVLIVSLVFYWKKLKQAKIICLLLIMQWFSYYFVFLITPRDARLHIENIINKLYIHLAPLAVLIIGYIIKYNLNSIRKIKLLNKPFG